MAINGSGGNGLPEAIIGVIEQTNFLERRLREAIHAKLVLRKAAAQNNLAQNWFEGQIGETKTFSRSNPIAPQATSLNPSNNTGLDNGITPATRAFEQWQAQLYEWANGVNINVLGNETLIGDLFIDNMAQLGAAAANSVEIVCVQRAWTAYDSGDTFNTVAITAGASLHVDNINGFTTQYLGTYAPSYGLPQPVSSTNTLAVLILNSSGAVLASSAVSGYTTDSSNTSIMQTGGQAFGQSGTLLLTVAPSVTIPVGSRVVTMDANNPSTTAFNPVYKDSAFIVRPLASGVMVQNAWQMAATNVIVPSVSIPQAVSILRGRNVPTLSNGLYGCLIDARLLAQFYQDEGFMYATMGTWDKSPVFTNGIIAKSWGVEFVEATQLPVYSAPNQGGASSFNLRHAFVFGEDVISEHPFKPLVVATNRPAQMGDVFDFRFEDHIEFITQAALDRLGEVVKMSYKYVGDFEPGTDKGSNPSIVFTSDYMRYKRGVVIQAASAS